MDARTMISDIHHFLSSHFEWTLCVLILVGRLGDILSTYLITPGLSLEANPVARKLGWRFMLSSILVCLVPFYSPPLGIIILVPSLMVSASNIGKIWFVRTYGEAEYLQLLLGVARKSQLRHALAGVLLSAFFIALSGLVLLVLSPDPSEDWGCWFAIGILTYALAIALHGSAFCFRIFKMAKSQNAPSE